MKIKVKGREFTYWDKDGYHTVVGYGEVPPDNPEVSIALNIGFLEEVKGTVKVNIQPEKTEYKNKKGKKEG